jgi:hypothetical protein
VEVEEARSHLTASKKKCTFYNSNNSEFTHKLKPLDVLGLLLPKTLKAVDEK